MIINSAQVLVKLLLSMQVYRGMKMLLKVFCLLLCFAREIMLQKVL